METDKTMVTSCCGSEQYAWEFGTEGDMCAMCTECGEWAGLEEQDD